MHFFRVQKSFYSFLIQSLFTRIVQSFFRLSETEFFPDSVLPYNIILFQLQLAFLWYIYSFSTFYEPLLHIMYNTTIILLNIVPIKQIIFWFNFHFFNGTFFQEIFSLLSSNFLILGFKIHLTPLFSGANISTAE